MFAEGALDSPGFDLIAHLGGGAVRVDVIDLISLDACVLNGTLHHAKGAVAVLGRAGDVMRVRAHSVAHDLSEYGRSSPARLLQLLQNEHARSFSHHETIALSVPWPRGLLRLIVTLRKGSHSGKTADAQRCYGCFSTPADHHVRVAALDDLKRIADRVRARSARGCGSRVGSLGAGTNGHI